MIRNCKRLVFGTACLAVCGKAVFGQTPPPVILGIDVVNQVNYESDVPDYSKLATDPSSTTGVVAKNFSYYISIGDIVAINGKPAKGTFIARQTSVNLNPNAAPGQAIADTTRANVHQVSWEILSADGTAVGTIIATGLGQGPAPPGAPLMTAQGNSAIVGGTGAFLGVRGQQGSALPVTAMSPLVSVTEDPANRRLRNGGALHYVVHLIPMSRPEIVIASSGPAVFHADFSPVTTAKPAKAGELLIVKATGLGPTVPGVDPGQPFPSDATQTVNSPVDIMVNGQSAEVLNKIGWPGLVDTYRLDFRLPGGIAGGTAAIQATAAWITGSSVNIPIQ